MSEELLTVILMVEKEIRERLAAAEAEAMARIAALKERLEQEFEQERQRLQHQGHERVVLAEQAAREEGAALLSCAEAYAGRLAGLPDAELARVTSQYLDRLRPEGTHDRQDEQD